MPTSYAGWWKTDLKLKNGTSKKNLLVREMVTDVLTDLAGLKSIIYLNTYQLRIYQFDRPIPDNLEIERLTENSRNKVLKQNGLKHFFFLSYEFVKIQSFDPEYISKIESHPTFEKRIKERKRNM